MILGSVAHGVEKQTVASVNSRSNKVIIAATAGAAALGGCMHVLLVEDSTIGGTMCSMVMHAAWGVAAGYILKQRQHMLAHRSASKQANKRIVNKKSK